MVLKEQTKNLDP